MKSLFNIQKHYKGNLIKKFTGIYDGYTPLNLSKKYFLGKIYVFFFLLSWLMKLFLKKIWEFISTTTTTTLNLH